MKWLLFIIGGSIVALVVMLSLLKIRVKIDYRHDKKTDRLTIYVSTVAGLIRFKRTFSILEFDVDDRNVRIEETTTHSFSEKQNQKKRQITQDQLKSGQQKGQRLKTNIVGLYQIITAFLSHVHCERLTWHSIVGTGDAAETGVLTGLLWSLKSVILGWGSQFVNMKTPSNFLVTPDFNHLRLETHFTCILKFRLGHDIFAGVRILVHTKKIRFNKEAKQSQRVANQSA